MEYSQVVRQSFLVRSFKGSNPFIPKFCIMITAPLEQFQILSILPLKLFGLDFSITNFLLMNILVLVSIISIIYFNSSYNNYLKEASFYFIANSWQKVLELVSEISAQLVSDTITKDNEKFFPVISVLFNFILFSNLLGLVPYSFTATSHFFNFMRNL